MKKPKTTHRPAFQNTRKVLRKNKRIQKKKNRQEHYLKKKEERKQPVNTPGRFVKRPSDDGDSKKEPKAKKPKLQPAAQDILSRQQQKEKKDEERLKSQMAEQRRNILLKANEDEDKLIKKLEKQLGLKKSKNKNNFFADDGLDYLLEICDRSTTEQIVAAEKHLADIEGDSDFEGDLAAVTGKELKDKAKKKKNSDKVAKRDGSDDENSENNESDDELDNVDEDSVDEEFDEDLSDDEHSVSDNDEITKKSSGRNKNKSKLDKSDEILHSMSEDDSEMIEESDVEEKSIKKRKSEMKQSKKPLVKIDRDKKSAKQEKVISEEDLNKVFSDDEISHLSDDDDFDVGDLSGDIINENTGKVEQKEKPDVWEDIYGRKRDKDGNIIKEEKGVYIPPYLRNKDSSSDQELQQLKRQIKSVLNKLAGTNLHWASTTIENLYSNNSRNAVNTCLTQQWLDATMGISATPDRMVAEHAALVAVLHANVGSEIGAHFLQDLTKKFDEMLQTQQPIEDKRLDNLVSCLAYLYGFKIYQASLLYDILGRLVDELSEKHIDCVLTALRGVGGVLRKEEPAALKTFIHDAQAKIAGFNQTDSRSRVKFLVDVLMAVKNNNLTKIPNYEPTYADHLRKTVRGVIRRGNHIVTLNIRLEDLLKAEERGKWWVVGSAWEGNARTEEKTTKPLPNADQKLLELARKQRMNTDVRRSIFCVIMSAEDYTDALEKLERLGLRGAQSREVVHVALACCLQERTHNPYYALLVAALCVHDRRHQLSVQYSVWDKIKEMDSLSKQAMTNLAQFLTHLIIEKALPLSVLKIIQFSDLNKRSVRFMRQILLAIIMNADLQASLEVFQRISKPPKLHMFRESLRLFIQHFLIKNAGKQTSVLSEQEMATLKERTLEVDRILTMHETKLRL